MDSNKSCSTSLSSGNQVDGLPLALHTEAVGDPHGVGGPAPIYALEVRKLKIERIYDSTLPIWIIEVLDSIVKFHLV